MGKQTAKSKNKTMTWGPSHSFDSDGDGDGDGDDDNVNNDHGNAVDCNGDDSEVRYDSSVGPQTPEAISPPKDDDDENIPLAACRASNHNTNHNTNTSSKRIPTPLKLLNGIWNCASETYNEYVGNGAGIGIGMGACSTACNQCQGDEASWNANANGKYQQIHSQTTISVQQEVQKTYSSPQARNGYKNCNGKHLSQSDILGYPSSSQKKNSNSNGNGNGNIPKRKSKRDSIGTC